jgi:uncharacterized iron-regulated membrane protein
MWSSIGWTLSGLAVLGVMVLGYSAWRDRRREDDAAGEVSPLSSGGKGEE